MPLSNDRERKTQFHQLTEAEIANPYLVIDELFDFTHLPDARELLWEWLKATVTCTYHKNLTATERSAILTLYEKMEKLVEAVYVLHEKNLTPKNRKKKNSRKGARAQRN